MNKFVDVPREAFEAKMREAGFELELPVRRGQLVFIRRNHNNQELVVKIYSSIPSNAGAARDCGEDSIRVVAVYEPPKMKSRGLFKAKVLRVNSVEGVLTRTLEQAREAYRRCNDAVKTIGKPRVSVKA